MSSTYTSSLQIQLMGNGDQPGTWGTTTNTNWQLMEDSVAGVVSITMLDADYTLTVIDGATDEARNMVVVATGTNTASRKIVAPLKEKIYIVVNNTTGGFNITVGGSTGSAVTIPNGYSSLVYCNGTNFYAAGTAFNSNVVASGDMVAAGALGAGTNLAVTGAAAIGGNTSIGGTGAVTGNFSASSALNAYTAASYSATISGTTMTVASVTSGTVVVGQKISGAGVTAGSFITALGTGTGGTGTYTLSASSSVSPATTITGTAQVLVPTAATADSSLNAASTAYVQTNLASYAPLAGPTFSGTVSDALGPLRSVPIETKSTSYTLVAGDNGQCVSTTAGVIIPASVMSAGNVVTIYNNSGSSITLTQGTGLTLQFAGQATSTTGNRTLQLYSIATVIFISSTVAVISGAGLA